MKILAWIIVVVVVVTVILAAALGWSLTKPGVPVVTGRIYQDSNYGGTRGALDEWDTPVSCYQVIIRYAGAEGTAEISGQTSSSWGVYVSNGKIIDQVQVDEDGVYRFPLDWQPKGPFTGHEDQEVVTVLYQVEVLVPQGSYVKAITSSQVRIRLTEDAKVIPGPSFLVSQYQ